MRAHHLPRSIAVTSGRAAPTPPWANSASLNSTCPSDRSPVLCSIRLPADVSFWQAPNGQSVRVPETSEFTTSDGVVIRFACLGTGRPLYLCHGGPLGDRRGMAAQVAALRDRFTLLSYDYRGAARRRPRLYRRMTSSTSRMTSTSCGCISATNMSTCSRTRWAFPSRCISLSAIHTQRDAWRWRGVRRYRRAGCLGP
jgi:pimeloyl-ACP methyl ester carboxylesterase